MGRGGRRSGSLPANYGKLRLPLRVIIGRIEAGKELRREQHDTGAGAEGRSIYDRRGVLALETR